MEFKHKENIRKSGGGSAIRFSLRLKECGQSKQIIMIIVLPVTSMNIRTDPHYYFLLSFHHVIKHIGEG